MVDWLPPSVRALVGTADRLTLSAASVWEAEHALAAAHLPLHHRDPFDRMLVGQAMLEDLVLVSKDQAVRRYGVPTAW